MPLHQWWRKKFYNTDHQEGSPAVLYESVWQQILSLVIFLWHCTLKHYGFKMDRFRQSWCFCYYLSLGLTLTNTLACYWIRPLLISIFLSYRPLGPISLTFYEQLLCQNPFAKNLQTQIVSTLKLHKKTFVQKSCS
jgi:hypothetical protein